MDETAPDQPLAVQGGEAQRSSHVAIRAGIEGRLLSTASDSSIDILISSHVYMSSLHQYPHGGN